MTDATHLFNAVRAIKGSALTQADVDAINAALPTITVAATTGAKPSYLPVLLKYLEREEGRVASAYQDHLGYWTIGIGRLIDKRKGGRLTDPEIDMLLANDVARFAVEMATWPAWKRVKDDPVRASALLSMCFQMGSAGLAKFTGSLPMIAAGMWSAAADALLQSAWAKQTPARAKRVTDMIRTGSMA